MREPHVPSALAWSMLVAGRWPRQALRWWCIATLGPQWNTRVIVVPGLAAGDDGPVPMAPTPTMSRWCVEGIALPLVHAAWITALVFTVLNAVLLTVRVRVEERRRCAPCPRETADA